MGTLGIGQNINIFPMYSLYKVQFPEKYRDEKTCSKAMTVD
jgi:hypothetical protein